jgi:predicted Co/Zn/Cd cation transporter (cation efflux family)
VNPHYAYLQIGIFVGLDLAISLATLQQLRATFAKICHWWYNTSKRDETDTSGLARLLEPDCDSWSFQMAIGLSLIVGFVGGWYLTSLVLIVVRRFT